MAVRYVARDHIDAPYARAALKPREKGIHARDHGLHHGENKLVAVWKGLPEYRRPADDKCFGQPVIKADPAGLLEAFCRVNAIAHAIVLISGNDQRAASRKLPSHHGVKGFPAHNHGMAHRSGLEMQEISGKVPGQSAVPADAVILIQCRNGNKTKTAEHERTSPEISSFGYFTY